MEKISFVIPCYGSEKTIEFVTNEIIEVVSQKPEFDYEIICVNDYSPDNVFEVLKKLAENNSKIKVIDFAKNFGKHSAVLAGHKLATGDYVVSLDDDGQCPMDRLWDLMQPIFDGKADFTMAKYDELKQSIFKKFGSKVNNFTSMVLIDKPKDLHFSNFCAMKQFVAKEMVNYNNPYPYLEGLTLRTTRNIVTVPMSERDRVSGQGNFTFKKSLSLWVNGFTAFSVIPLRIASVMGCVFAILGFIFGLIVVVRKIINPIIAIGYSSTVAIVLFIGGIIMLMLGLIGEYLGRVYISLNNSPQYVIRDIINGDV